MQHRRFAGGWVALAVVSLIANAASAQTPGTPPTPADGTQDAARAAKWLQSAFKGQTTPEAARMLIAIAQGSKMGPGEGWFGPGQGRYGWKWLANRHGVKPGEAISRDQFKGPPALFARLDRNKDGRLRADDFDWSDRTFYAQQGMMTSFWFFRLNKGADGRLTREEWLKFFDDAARGKDHLTGDNLREALFAGGLPRMTPADLPTPETLVRGLFRGEIGSTHEGPKLNDPAPDFSLKTMNGKETVRLRDHLGNKPVVLVFGNFTCGPFRSTYPRVDELALRYKNDAVFLCVYVREAHPTDGWRMGSNDKAGVAFAQPRDFAERMSLANRCGARLKMNVPLLVDEMDDRVGHAYSGMPARLYVIDRAGKIAYKSGRGPFGFKPDELEQALVLTLLDESPRPAKSRARVPLLSEPEAWKLLPLTGRGVGQPLPAWARALSRTLPATTAAMLELDYRHRVRSPLGPRLAGKMRWLAARANRCAYAAAFALADLRRAGVKEDELRVLTGDPARWPEAERAALTFARKLTEKASQVSDEEVAALVKQYGDKKVVAMVLLLAHANFQDRLLLALGLKPESGGPLPSLEVSLALPAQPPGVPVRRKPEASVGPGQPQAADWKAFDFATLRKQMDLQRARPGRIRVPTWEEVSKQVDGGRRRRPLRIKWSLVCLGYQPELALGWGACTGNFGREAKQDRVFEESLFWVVTRSLECFY